MNKVAVIIPYFQRKAGLLTAAITSIRQQIAFARIQQIIIIDDSSPRKAVLDLEPFLFDPELQTKLQLVEQVNTGVSAARNAGLDLVANDVEYVAFLDPDDVWLETHLSSALAALDKNSDFHFANFTHIGQSIGAFERTKFFQITEHKLLLKPDIYQYCTDMVRQITTVNIIGTSTVVYRFSLAKKVRFERQFTFAGEDYLMWLALIACCFKISFTSSITAHYGEGVNLFSGAIWGSRHMCVRLLDEINYRSYILNNIALERDNQLMIKQVIAANRKAYIGNVMSMLKRFKLNIIWLVLQQLWLNNDFRKVMLNK
ncbi:glycosyltransferase family A protein [Rheinheimera sp. MMS21-TC3]|uniref:glycosyltransferase family A protein n=1 Tax=Rheinheimera sp. MMS21-TC3 TaxID=3072790 RepID=UPI0028C4C1AB|nr:glycosyltransferase family A protein [Rheinheimera sp. MMS21-TC3]WNO60682.1 glycosyltransferase family A protein [Rheinheimera sp. MMS21-TC3]